MISASSARRHMRRQLQQAVLYATLAEMEGDAQSKERLMNLSEGARALARHWAESAQLEKPDESGISAGVVNGILIFMARIFGITRIVGILALSELRTQAAYAAASASGTVMQDARHQAEELSHLRRHTSVTSDGTNLRAAVLGMNDGLVSNFSITMGVVGGSTDIAVIILAGTASLIAGSLSMAAGEYISVKSQREVTEKLIEEERIAVKAWPQHQVKELREIYVSKGLTDTEAGHIAQRIGESPDSVLETKLRERFGVDPEDLGSPTGAAFYSMLAFAVGAVVPLLPFFIAQTVGVWVALASVLASAVALLAVGGGLSLLSRVSPVWGALRMLLIGAIAAGITFSVGTLLGVTVI